MSPAETRRLEALGYVGSGGDAGRVDRPDPKDMIGPWEQAGMALELSAAGEHERALGLIQASIRQLPGPQSKPAMLPPDSSSVIFAIPPILSTARDSSLP